MEKRSNDEPRYVDLTSDAGFKAVFCDRDNKDVLITLLNTFLPAERQIDDIVEYSDREISGFTTYNKSVRLDLRCKDSDGRSFIVEVQREPQRDFFKRCISYCSAVYNSGIIAGEEYGRLTPVYLIAFMTRPMLEEELLQEHGAISRYRFMDEEYKNFAPDTIIVTFVRLDEAKATLEECGTEQERCMYYLMHMPHMKECPPEEKEGGICRLFERSEIAAFTPEKKTKYIEAMITERDFKAKMEYQFEDGERTGYDRGLVEGDKAGYARGLLATAKAALLEGLDTAMISRMTGLSEQEVNALKS